MVTIILKIQVYDVEQQPKKIKQPKYGDEKKIKLFTCCPIVKNNEIENETKINKNFANLHNISNKQIAIKIITHKSIWPIIKFWNLCL